MKRFVFPALVAVALIVSSLPSFAADPKVQLQELVEKVKTKLKAGKNSAQDLADELKSFDTLLSEHQLNRSDEVAKIAFMKATLYAQVLDDDDTASKLLKQVQVDFPGTPTAKNAESMLTSLTQQSEAKKIQRSLVAGTPFPDFEEKDMGGKPLSIAGLKGKVVLIDFWATWCGPCIAELPNVLKAYEKHRDSGFEIIGISLDKDEAKLTTFLKEKGMTWPQHFDGKGWQNKLAVKYGVNSIPATYLLDKEGKIIAKDLRGEALEKAVAGAVK